VHEEATPGVEPVAAEVWVPAFVTTGCAPDGAAPHPQWTAGKNRLSCRWRDRRWHHRWRPIAARSPSRSACATARHSRAEWRGRSAPSARTPKRRRSRRNRRRPSRAVRLPAPSRRPEYLAAGTRRGAALPGRPRPRHRRNCDATRPRDSRGSLCNARAVEANARNSCRCG
jgi:hypothetical protein